MIKPSEDPVIHGPSNALVVKAAEDPVSNHGHLNPAVKEASEDLRREGCQDHIYHSRSLAKGRELSE